MHHQHPPSDFSSADSSRLRNFIAAAAVACALGCGAAGANAQVSLDAQLQEETLQHHFPAMAAAVMVKGQLVAVGSAGTRRIGTATPVTRNDRFHLGSDTKAMTAALAAMLIDEKDSKLRWESTLGEVFPALAPKMHASVRQISLTQLLAHSSGLPADNEAFGELLLQATLQTGNLDEQRYWMLQQIAGKPTEAPPGTRFAYSNLGYIIAGAILEKTSGKTWEELMVERLFTPLGLGTAGLGPQATMGRVDAPLGHRMAGGKLVAVLSGPEADNPPILGPAGTAHMSVLDFTRWGSWMAGQGQRAPRLLKPESMKRLMTPAIAMPIASTTSTTVSGAAQYAQGWAILNMAWAQTPLVFHGGSNTSNKAYIWLDLQRDAVITVVTNVATPNTEDAMMTLAGKLYAAHVLTAAP